MIKCQTEPYSLFCNLLTYRVTPIFSYVSKLGSSKLCGSNVIVTYTYPPQHTVEKAVYDARVDKAEEYNEDEGEAGEAGEEKEERGGEV